MAVTLSYVQYLGDGVTTDFAVPFKYIDKAHVEVKVDGVAVSFTWPDDSTVSLSTAPATDLVVDVRRSTPREDRLVVFADGSVTTAKLHNLAHNQNFMVVQEAFDFAGAQLALADDGSYSAQTRRIADLGDPVNPQDAVTRNFAETGMTSQLNKAETEASNAASSATAAATSETNAANSATAAASSATDAANSATAAGTSETNAATSETNAAASATNAATSETNAATSETNAADSATLADSFRALAKKWAEELEDIEVTAGEYSAYHWAQKALAAAEPVPAGKVDWFAMSTAPAGYLKANGALVSRTTYADLFNAIGETFGAGNGIDNFQLPDLRGEVIRGWDDGRGVDLNRLFGSGQTSALGSHSHTGSADTGGNHQHYINVTTNSTGNHDHNLRTESGSGGNTGQLSLGTGNTRKNTRNPIDHDGAHSHSVKGWSDTGGDHTHSLTIDAAGGAETRARNVALLACIKT